MDKQEASKYTGLGSGKRDFVTMNEELIQRIRDRRDFWEYPLSRKKI
jgi:hypothetical protein